MIKHKLLSYCGLYCGGCKNYQENSGEYQCQGCRVEDKLVSDCPTKACAAGKNLLHCGQCSDFPCATLDNFYQDGLKHHALAFVNIQRLNNLGPEEWLKEQEKEHTCQCGKNLLWEAEQCCMTATDNSQG
jgi:hypothetical protein